MYYILRYIKQLHFSHLNLNILAQYQQIHFAGKRKIRKKWRISQCHAILELKGFSCVLVGLNCYVTILWTRWFKEKKKFSQIWGWELKDQGTDRFDVWGGYSFCFSEWYMVERQTQIIFLIRWLILFSEAATVWISYVPKIQSVALSDCGTLLTIIHGKLVLYD